ncbi:hypothetical protein FA10DRAFT_267294 [Acaromyces ingoldii]|uniref:Uncharacterized protein n=1 Tax=Acaromyces ingoldii TaxID=215250 RepID=A0A316YT05_9BASI|nr:hypothetical protein FA10DRAFT_267294 [Acaromyces ingoldii]PWN90865.1 hypothetical protein FA10DRAFT_267294 [Acaromyces ingoldii]
MPTSASLLFSSMPLKSPSPLPPPLNYRTPPNVSVALETGPRPAATSSPSKPSLSTPPKTRNGANDLLSPPNEELVKLKELRQKCIETLAAKKRSGTGDLQECSRSQTPLAAPASTSTTPSPSSKKRVNGKKRTSEDERLINVSDKENGESLNK